MKRKLKKTAKSKDEIKTTRSSSRTILAKEVAAILVDSPASSVGDALRAVGASEHLATHPAKLTTSIEWNELLDAYLPQGELLEVHKGLLRASHIDHMIFADGPRSEAACAEFLATYNAKNEAKQMHREDVLTDDDIRMMLAEKNCTVRRISRTENSRHVYFFAPDSRARKDGLDMAYKLRGSYAADKAAVAFSLAALAASRDREALPQAPSGPILPNAAD